MCRSGCRETRKRSIDPFSVFVIRHAEKGSIRFRHVEKDRSVYCIRPTAIRA
jgi:hypothetical protein